MTKISTRDAAEFLANVNSDGASDEKFAETVLLAYKMWKEGKSDVSLTKRDFLECDPEKISTTLKDILSEIIFSEDIDESAWWKVKEEEVS